MPGQERRMGADDKQSKRERTRLRVINAAIDCIYEDGFNAAHTNRIAEAAGVSWGVLQYHFGDKDGLLQAVLDHIYDEFHRTLGQARPDGQDLQQRVSQVIDVVWSLVSRREYRVSVAILRNAGKDKASRINGQQQVSKWARKTSELWERLFEGEIGQPQQSDIARHLMFAALRGLVDEINPGRRSPALLQQERDALAAAITFLLTHP